MNSNQILTEMCPMLNFVKFDFHTLRNNSWKQKFKKQLGFLEINYVSYLYTFETFATSKNN